NHRCNESVKCAEECDGLMRSEVAVMARNFPVEEDIFHCGACADVVHDHVPSTARRFLIDYNSNMGNAAAEVPCNEVAGRIICGTGRDWQCLALAAEENHQIRDAAMVDVWIGTG